VSVNLINAERKLNKGFLITVFCLLDITTHAWIMSANRSTRLRHYNSFVHKNMQDN